MSLPVFTWVLDNSEERLGNRLTLLALAEHAHDDGSKAYPSITTLMKRTRLSERQVRNCLRSLEQNGAITATGKSPSGTNVYRVSGPFNEGAKSDERQILPGAKSGSQNAPEPSDPSEKNLKTYTQIADAWLSRIELIAHRPTYFEDAKVQREIDKAVKRYGLDDVIAAITSYATVLASPAHFWNHSWTLKDFLVRGLDRFVPEAKPEQVFRQNGGGTSDGDEKIPTKYARDDDD